MLSSYLSRRTFFKASLLGTLALGNNRLVFAQQMVEPKYPLGTVSLYNTHTGEKLATTYRMPDGSYDVEALKSLNWILRCHYTNEVADIDIRVLDFMNMVDNQLGGNNEIHIISGFRSQEYNRMLRQKSLQVAKKSLHLKGKALDIAIPGVKLSTLRKVALSLRQGGVGYYPKTGFVHIDSGELRTW